MTSFRLKVDSLTPWFINSRPNPKANLRLFCFPYAGGGLSIYRKWPESLPANVEVWAANLPGREGRLDSPAFTDISPLVESLATALVPYSDKPYVFFGHSMGALIGFELARQLRKEGRNMPVHLFVSGRRAPQLVSHSPTTYNLPESELLKELRKLNGTPRNVLENPELMQLMLPLLRADFQLVETYSCALEPPLECSITAYSGLQDLDITRDHLKAWSEQTTGSFMARAMPGDHFFINSQPVFFQALSLDLHRVVKAASLEALNV